MPDQPTSRWRCCQPDRRARAPGQRRGPAATPDPSRPAAAKQQVSASVLDLLDTDAAEVAEQAEQLCYEFHLADQHAPDCPSPCPWCAGGWAA